MSEFVCLYTFLDLWSALCIKFSNSYSKWKTVFTVYACGLFSKVQWMDKLMLWCHKLIDKLGLGERAQTPPKDCTFKYAHFWGF